MMALLSGVQRLVIALQSQITIGSLISVLVPDLTKALSSRQAGYSLPEFDLLRIQHRRIPVAAGSPTR